MSYSTLEKSGDDLQRKREQIERKWHIGRAFVCHKGGFQHEHLSKKNCLSCTGENIRTEQKQKYEQLLNDKDLEIAAEKSKIKVCYKGGFMHEHLSADDAQRCVGLDTERRLKREQARYLKDQDLRIAVERTRRTELVQAEQTRRLERAQLEETKRVETVEETKRVQTVEETKRLEIRANRERQTAEEDLNRMRMQHALEMRRLETENSANMERSMVEELVNSLRDLIIRSNNHESTLNGGSQISLRPVRQNLNEW